MKILLIGNYPYLKSQSMNRFAAVLFNGLKLRGYEVRLLTPPPLIGRLRPSPTGMGKWIGYIDRFILFRPRFCKAADWADVVHICDHANAVYVPWLDGKPHVVTCHDMLAIRNALGEIIENRTGLTGKIYQRWILSGLNHAMDVACVSDTTRGDVLRLTHLQPKKVNVVRDGLNYPYRPMSEANYVEYLHQMRLRDMRPFFLHVGGNFWYKNREGLLRIFAQMVRLSRESKLNLILAGAGLSEELRFLALELGIRNRIREVGIINNEQLEALYSAADGLIFPSLAEGFGWPIIEAQACGCPVYTSKRKPMTEVVGDGAGYFDPTDEGNAAQIILESSKDKDQLIRRGFENAKKYTTEAMIAGYIAAYERVLR